jgi:UDP-N-acetyl-D-galactosamine dehydrogenase
MGMNHTLKLLEDDIGKPDHPSFTFDFEHLRETRVFNVTSPTPVASVNRPDLEPLVKASETVGQVFSWAMLRFGGLILRI